MPKKKGSVPDLPASLPAHAVAEIEADPAQLGWWLRWAAAGDAKETHREAAARFHLAGKERKAHQWKCKEPKGCDDCKAANDLVDRLAAEMVETHRAVLAAIQAFKEG